MARVLIVGCGGRGRALGAALADDGHAVRGTSRSADGVAAIETAGFEGVLADPDRLGTLLPALAGVSAMVWLMGGADAPAVNSERLGAVLEKLVDTPVRGFVYEAAGSAEPAVLAAGAELARAAADTWHMPVEVVEADPAADRAAWVAAMRAAAAAVLT